MGAGKVDTSLWDMGMALKWLTLGHIGACQLHSNLLETGRNHSDINLETLGSDPSHLPFLHPRTMCFLGLLIPEQFLTKGYTHLLAYLQ